MNRQGLTQTEYAKRAGVTQQAVAKWIKSNQLVLHPDGSIDPDASDMRRAELVSGIHGGKRETPPDDRFDDLDLDDLSDDDLTDSLPPNALLGLSRAQLERYYLAQRAAKMANDNRISKAEADLIEGRALDADKLRPLWLNELTRFKQALLRVGAVATAEIVAAVRASDSEIEAHRAVKAILDKQHKQALNELSEAAPGVSDDYR